MFSRMDPHVMITSLLCYRSQLYKADWSSTIDTHTQLATSIKILQPTLKYCCRSSLEWPRLRQKKRRGDRNHRKANKNLGQYVCNQGVMAYSPAGQNALQNLSILRRLRIVDSNGLPRNNIFRAIITSVRNKPLRFGSTIISLYLSFVEIY